MTNFFNIIFRKIFYKTTPSSLELKMGYIFSNPKLLKTALTHRSITEKNYLSYERLEFLGDAVLELVVSEFLFKKYPKKTEGFLTKTRSGLVKADSLFEVSIKLNLPDHCITDKGLELTKDPSQSKLLSNFVEAIIGAIYLDRGYKHAEHFINKWIISKNDVEMSSNFNFKGNLIEYSQKNFKKLPKFVVDNVEGPDHERQYTISVHIDNNNLGTGTGRTKLGAEQEAALQALESLKVKYQIAE